MQREHSLRRARRLLTLDARMVRFRLRLQVHEYELPAGMTIIGRAPSCNLTIDDALLSREHAAITVGGERVVARDLGSRNGTYVNGLRVEGEIELRDGDRVKIGATEAIFSRVVRSRRPLSATTGAVATCRTCASPYVAPAPNCPRCGAASPAGAERRTESQTRRDFWLSLEVELLDRAMELLRLGEAEDIVLRLQTKLDELLAVNARFEQTALERALSAVVRFSLARGTSRKIGWVLDVLRKLDLLPGAELFALIAATPPILLEEVSDNLGALIAHHRARVTGAAEGRCLQSLALLCDDLVALGARRADDTEPHDPVAVL